jgi:hypothetical protein
VGCLQFRLAGVCRFRTRRDVPAAARDPGELGVLSVIWWSGAFFTGFTLVSLSPARGAAASVLLALMGEALLIALRLTVFDGQVLRIPGVVFWSMTTFTAVPLLAGADGRVAGSSAPARPVPR